MTPACPVLGDFFEPGEPAHTLVDRGAYSGGGANCWLEFCATAAAKTGEVNLTIFFLVGGTAAGVDLLAGSVHRLGCPERSIAVRNLGVAPTFPAFEASEVASMIRRHGAVIDLPPLKPEVFGRVDAVGLPFADFAKGPAGLLPEEVHHVARWLAQAWRQIGLVEPLLPQSLATSGRGWP